MNELGIRVRDTFRSDENLDDAISNGHQNGPHLFRIEWDANAVGATASCNKVYDVDGCDSAAWDRYRIVIPTRFQAERRDDPIVHECVHFLQHTTKAEAENYIQFTEDSHVAYAKYLAQRVELEAHHVQIAYIVKHCPSYMAKQLTPDQIVEVHKLLAACGNGAPWHQTFQLATYCKDKKLI